MHTLFGPDGRPLPDVAPFLRAIREQPEEDTHRLVLADVLQERDDPVRGDADHARLIRVQCEQARTPPFTARWLDQEREASGILSYRHDELTACPGRVGADYRGFTRGLPTTVRVRSPSRLRGIGRALNVGSIETLEIWVVRDGGVLAGQPAVARVSGLRLRNLRLGQLERLLGEADLSRVCRWAIDGYGITEPDVRALADAVRSGATSAEELDLSWSELDVSAVEPLAEVAAQMRGGRLTLSGSGVGLEILLHLTAVPPAGPDRGVRRLELRDEGVGDGEITALAHWPGARHLEYLDASDPDALWSRLTDAGLEALAASEYLAGLRGLDLAGTGVTDRGLAALAGVPAAWGLGWIDLSYTVVTPEGVGLLRDRFPDCVIGAPEPLG